ncbi:MAG: cytochrome c peroxidase [Myxococcota bacterium]
MASRSPDPICRPRRVPRLPAPILPAALSLAFACSLLWATGAGAQPLPPVPVPAANPITPQKAVLGKILFWDQQLSSDHTVACGSCHLTEFGGADPAVAVHPGADLTFFNADDIFGSPGVVRRDSSGAAIADPIFGFNRQVTGRAAPNFFGGLWNFEVLWDGRASTAFDDPITGVNLIPVDGTLESQSLGPILNSVEMSKDGRSWKSVTSQLAFVKPLALATMLPPDVAAAITAFPMYPDLFNAAFGTPDVTPARIAFAIATYERTLVSDQTPWDAFMAGVGTALTPAQQAGWNFFQGASCAGCHRPPLFADSRFASIGLRDIADDIGREVVTGLPSDRGHFKIPTLRNAGLKASYMHTGQFANLLNVVRFYQPGAPRFLPNLSPGIPVLLPPGVELPLVDFLQNGLTDPRVAARAFPFDRPVLAAPEPAGSWQLGAGLAALLGLRAARSRRRGR